MISGEYDQNQEHHIETAAVTWISNNYIFIACAAWFSNTTKMKISL